MNDFTSFMTDSIRKMQEMDSNLAKAAVAEFYQVYETHGKEAAFRVFNALEREFDALAREQRDIRPTSTEILYATSRFFEKHYLATYSRNGDLIRFSNNPELAEYTGDFRPLGRDGLEAVREKSKTDAHQIFMEGLHVNQLFSGKAPFPPELKKNLEAEADA